MAFINLKLITELADETDIGQAFADSQCFHSDKKEDSLNGEQFMRLTKIYRQANNLVKELKHLHEVCTDFAAGNFQKYIDWYNESAEANAPYDPIDDIRYAFDSGSVTDLPRRIEQYPELIAFAATYADQRAIRREGFKKFFSNVGLGYLGKDADGSIVIVPANEMPENVVNTIEANREIKEIEVEYCLDRYNDFYHAATCLIEIHACSAEYETEEQAAQGLAKEILGYFD